MKTIGGSLFIRNAFKYDYCVKQAINSILPICDQVVVLDCESDDGTAEMLRDFASNTTKVKLVEGVKWECAENYDRLKILANQAIDQLDTDWHLMIQADEVLHECSYPFIRQAVDKALDHDGYMVRRINLFGNIDNYIRHDLTGKGKPCSDYVVRLSRRGNYASGDAESVAVANCSREFQDNIYMFHYSYVRKNQANLTKAIDMQSWFHGSGAQPDQRLVDMQSKDGVFRPEQFFSWDDLAPIYLNHPSVVTGWVDERRNEFPKRPD